METVSMFSSVIIPLGLTALVFLLPLVRKIAEKLREREAARSKVVEDFHTEAMQVMKSTDPEADADVRLLIAYVAEEMMKGTKLIRGVLLAQNGRAKDDTGSEFQSRMESLSDEVRHGVARTLALSLIVSSFNSLMFGRFYRSVLALAMQSGERELNNPSQIVIRMKANTSFRPSILEAAPTQQAT